MDYATSRKVPDSNPYEVITFFNRSNPSSCTMSLGWAQPLAHVIAQAVSCQLPTAATQVRAQVRSYAICSGQSGTGTGFL
jgi:hypothetical protein